MTVTLIRTPEDVCVHCQQGIYFQGMWRHLSSLTSACDNGRTNAQPATGSRWTPPAVGTVVTPVPAHDVAAAAVEMRRRSPEERRAYLAEQRARYVAHGASEAWLAAFDAFAGEQDWRA